MSDLAPGPALIERLCLLGYRTQVEQAAALGISQPAVSKLAAGTRNPRGSVVRVVELLEEAARRPEGEQ